MALNDTSAAYLNQWTELFSFFAEADNAAAIASRSKFANRVGLFRNDLIIAQELSAEANSSLEGYTVAKNLSKSEASDFACGLAGEAMAFAIEKNNTALELQMGKLTKSYLYNSVADGDFAGVLQDLHDTLEPYTTVLVPECLEYFTGANLLTLLTARLDFISKMNLYSLKEDGLFQGRLQV